MGSFTAIVAGVTLYVGQYSGAIFRFAFGLIQAVTVLIAAIIVVLSLLVIRRAGMRCQPRSDSASRVLLRASLAAIVASAGIGLLDFLYGRSTSVIPSKPFAGQATIDDPSGRKATRRDERLYSLPLRRETQLVRLNGDGSTVVDELAGLTGGSGTYHAIKSNGHNYLVAIGRRAARTPPRLREQIAYGTSSDWMIQYSTACFFNTDGRLLGQLGGRIATVLGFVLLPFGTWRRWIGGGLIGMVLLIMLSIVIPMVLFRNHPRQASGDPRSPAEQQFTHAIEPYVAPAGFLLRATCGAMHSQRKKTNLA